MRNCPNLSFWAEHGVRSRRILAWQHDKRWLFSFPPVPRSFDKLRMTYDCCAVPTRQLQTPNSSLLTISVFIFSPKVTIWVSRTVKPTKLCYRIVNKSLNTVLSDHSILCREKWAFTTQTGISTKKFCDVCKSNRKVTKLVQIGCELCKSVL